MTFDRLLDIIAIVFGAGGILSFFVNLKRAKSQDTLDLSSAWQKFAAPLMDRLTYLETRTHEQDKEIGALTEKVTDQETEIEDLRGWAERLSKQVIKHNDTPEPFIRRKRQSIKDDR